MLARQALYHSSHIPSCLLHFLFLRQGLKLMIPSSSASGVAGITGVPCHAGLIVYIFGC
jgi:hypothetical protein